MYMYVYICIYTYTYTYAYTYTYTHTYIYRDTYVQYISVATNTTEPTNHGYTGQFILNLKLW